jgi:hypothetical protein
MVYKLPAQPVRQGTGGERGDRREGKHDKIVKRLCLGNF